MSPWPVDEEIEEVHLPRPGHADLAGVLKFDHTDVRNVLERASARETAARVAAGALAKVFLRAARRHGPQSRGAHRRGRRRPPWSPAAPEDFDGVDDSPVRCLDGEASAAMVAEIDRARKANESLGGVFEVRAYGVPPGLGSHIAWDQRHRCPARVRADVDPCDEGRGDRRRVRPRVAASARRPTTRSSGARSAATCARRTGPGGIEGGMTTGRPDRRERGDEAAADPHEAAALGGHRDQAAGRGAAGAHGLVHGPGGRRGGRGDGRAGAGPRRPREVRRRRDAGRARGGDAYRERIGWRR